MIGSNYLHCTWLLYNYYKLYTVLLLKKLVGQLLVKLGHFGNLFLGRFTHRIWFRKDAHVTRTFCRNKFPTSNRPAVPPRHSRVTGAASRSSRETDGPEIRGRERIGTRCPRRSRRRGCGSRDGTPSQSPASATPAQPDADRRRESVSTCDLTTINTIIN